MKIIYLSMLLSLPIFLHGQCYPDRHNTSWTAGWVSCETAKSPNENRGQSHWAYYDFGSVYSLAELKIWNLNIPQERASGMRTFEIDYSLDGQFWMHLGSFEMDQAPGTSIYEGETVVDWKGTQTRYVIITPTDNYGGPCVGFSEVRFNLTDQQTVATSNDDTNNDCLNLRVYPNPYTTHFTLDLRSDCEGTARYRVTNVLGQTVLSGQMPAAGSARQMEVRTDHLPAGNYALHITQGSSSLSRKLIQLGK
ncbi:discoidin domain-containing protein [Membranicola marinus]|uniref:Discoidin domain-containing protein n=1 Tax=Membranihabitans marinus TaxID=1227546 RepID=A0A953L7Q8_9BACT|nr:T9SS type A sorting domain-containing protein [Membranihabitans marinus]MBY5958977.1 discoidin domain-containing protein [Membranihabitans marinus]